MKCERLGRIILIYIILIKKSKVQSIYVAHMVLELIILEKSHLRGLKWKEGVGENKSFKNRNVRIKLLEKMIESGMSW